MKKVGQKLCHLLQPSAACAKKKGEAAGVTSMTAATQQTVGAGAGAAASAATTTRTADGGAEYDSTSSLKGQREDGEEGPAASRFGEGESSGNYQNSVYYCYTIKKRGGT